MPYRCFHPQFDRYHIGTYAFRLKPKIFFQYDLQFAGVDPLQAGNVVQLVLVLGLTIGWISTYIFRVSNKEMTYAQQLRDYEKQVMEVNNML